MKTMFGLMQWASGSIAVALMVVSLAAMPAQSAWADQISGGKMDTCTVTITTRNGVITNCAFDGTCIIANITVGCLQNTTYNSSNVTTACSTACN